MFASAYESAQSSSMFSAFSLQTSAMLIGAILLILYIWLWLHNTEMALHVTHVLFIGIGKLFAGIGIALWVVVRSIGNLFRRG